MDLDVNIIIQFYKERVAQLEHELIIEKTIVQQLQKELAEINQNKEG